MRAAMLSVGRISHGRTRLSPFPVPSSVVCRCYRRRRARDGFLRRVETRCTDDDTDARRQTRAASSQAGSQASWALRRERPGDSHTWRVSVFFRCRPSVRAT